ncbi:MAG: transketolase C-terminal domain-containing protein [Alphaproteobacteria bacterium]|jgi:pyruvate dehydrogenase E1 component beta subunit|nr:transketolase C-terminal domain-containing protein [Alphaproteobacteria bacterium]
MTDDRTITYAEALREGLSEAVKHDPSVYLLGEGIDDPGSFFGTTRGIAAEHGADRVIEMPVAENALTGVAVGAAMCGDRPVMQVHRVEFALLAFEQLVNNAAKAHYASNGQHKAPLVLRMIVGRGWGQGPQHSQSLETIFAHVPGLKVIMPTLPVDAKGMLISAIADDNPVVSIEHRWLYNTNGSVPEGYAPRQIERPAIISSGSDATVVATSYMTLEAIRAAEALDRQGCSIEVVDMRVLRPLDMTPIFESVRKTGRLLVVDTGWVSYGLGAEVLASVATECFGQLAVPPQRAGLADHPTPSSRGMVPGFYPDSLSIAAALGELCGLPDERLAMARSFIEQERGNQPIDTPDPYFRGPF